MSFEILNPPKGDLELIEKTREVLTAAKELGLEIDPEGFVYSWVGGTKLVVEYDGDKIVSVAVLTIGSRWTVNDITAHVLLMAGNKEGLLSFMKVMCQAANASSLFYQEDEPLEQTTEYNRHVIRELKVT